MKRIWDVDKIIEPTLCLDKMIPKGQKVGPLDLIVLFRWDLSPYRSFSSGGGWDKLLSILHYTLLISLPRFIIILSFSKPSLDSSAPKSHVWDQALNSLLIAKNVPVNPVIVRLNLNKSPNNLYFQPSWVTRRSVRVKKSGMGEEESSAFPRPLPRPPPLRISASSCRSEVRIELIYCVSSGVLISLTNVLPQRTRVRR